MKLITLYIPQPYLHSLDELIKAGYYPNRAEAIRLAVRDLVKIHSFKGQGKMKNDQIQET